MLDLIKTALELDRDQLLKPLKALQRPLSSHSLQQSASVGTSRKQMLRREDVNEDEGSFVLGSKPLGWRRPGLVEMPHYMKYNPPSTTIYPNIRVLYTELRLYVIKPP